MSSISRRSLLAGAAALPIISRAAGKPLIGLELYSVRSELAKDAPGTVRQVAKMGYEVVEFYAPYFSWTNDQAKDMRKLLDDLGIRCLSTHNNFSAFIDPDIGHAIELNHIIGSTCVVAASTSGKIDNLDGWKKTADTLAEGAAKLKSAGLKGGFHNHSTEFTPIDGKRPIEIIAANTPKEFVLQLDVGPCVEMRSDPVSWIERNPGRIQSLHLKDWDPQGGYEVLFGEGVAPWKKILAAAERVGGVTHYLIEQEGSRFTPMETAEKCLAAYKRIAAS